VVQIANIPFTVTAPANSGGGNWDANISIQPQIETQTFQAVTLSSANGSYAASLGQFVAPVMGLVSVATAPAGANTYPTFASPANATATIAAVDMGAFEAGQRRVLSIGLEIRNTTAEINKQGSVIYYRQPQTEESVILNRGAVGGPPQMAQCDIFRLPPGNAAAAGVIPDSREEEAANGAYVVGIHDPLKNNLRGGRWSSRLYTSADAGSSSPSTTTQPALISAVTTTTAFWAAATSGGATTTDVTFLTATEALKSTPFHTSGAYFSGLSPTTTLSGFVKVIYEVTPTADNLALISLANDGPEEDLYALELYQRAVKDMPPGVPVAENVSGDFWDGCLSLLSGAVNAIPIVGSGVSSGLKQLQKDRNKEVKEVKKAVKEAVQEVRPMDKRMFAAEKTANKNVAGKK
jgi:hypothetical protein